jgi:cold shock CspA family protein
MESFENKIHRGVIKLFNGIWGFIKSENLEVYFHKSEILNKIVIEKGDEVEFKIKPSAKKETIIRCYVIKLISKTKKIDKYEDKIGVLKWFDFDKGFGVIETVEHNEYFLHKSNLLSEKISVGSIFVFDANYEKGKKSARKCNLAQSYKDWLLALSYIGKNETISVGKGIYCKYINLITESSTQVIANIKNIKNIDKIDFFCELLLVSGPIDNNMDYWKIKNLANISEIDNDTKEFFLTTAYNQCDEERKYLMWLECDFCPTNEDEQRHLLANIQFFLQSFINTYVRIKDFSSSNNMSDALNAEFLDIIYEKANEHFRLQMLIDGLISSKDIQSNLLQQYLSGHKDIISEYEQIVEIANSDKIDEIIKTNFLKLVYEKFDAKYKYIEYKYKTLFEDYLLGIQKENKETQTELLQQYLMQLESIKREDSWFNGDKDWKYNQIKEIAYSNRIDETVKIIFLKYAYQIAEINYIYKMFFEDCLFDVQKEKKETQLELLLQYVLTSPSYLEYNLIKKITQSDKINELLKSDFLKLVYEQVGPECRCNMLIDGLRVLSKEDQGELLQQLENLSQNLGKENWQYYWTIERVAQSNEIDEIVKTKFLKFVYGSEIFLWHLGKYYQRKKHNSTLCNSLFENAFPNIPKINRLRLWLDGLNPNYNYFEFMQAAWQLSNDERRLFNKRVKEYAKDEREQQFINQISKAELLEETENTKVYKCKWRNLYYKQGTIQVFIDKTTATEDYKWEPAREEWNLLTQEYFNNKRIEDIIVKIDNNNHILNIEGLDDIEIKIVVAEIRKNGTSERRTTISSSQLTKIIHNVAARNQCINFLASQNSQYNAVDVQELVTEQYGSMYRDVSFLFPISDGKENVYLIWESAEFEKSKATHIFKIREENLEEMEEKIKNFIETNYRTRSRLNSVEIDDLEAKQDLQYFGRVNHDSVEYQVWEDRMKSELLFLK